MKEKLIKIYKHYLPMAVFSYDPDNKPDVTVIIQEDYDQSCELIIDGVSLRLTVLGIGFGSLKECMLSLVERRFINDIYMSSKYDMEQQQKKFLAAYHVTVMERLFYDSTVKNKLP